MEAIPAAGLAPDDVIAKLEKHKPAGNGKLWGGIYHEYEGDLTKLQNEVWGAYNCSNTLYPQVWPALRKFEAEIVRMTLDMVGASKSCAGLFSSGGTESIMIAVLAYREWGRSKGI